MSRLVTAYDRRTGKRVSIPEHWFDMRFGAAYTREDPSAVPAPITSPPVRRGSRSKAADSSTPAVADPVAAPEAPAAGDAEQESDPRC